MVQTGVIRHITLRQTIHQYSVIQILKTDPQEQNGHLFVMLLFLIKKEAASQSPGMKTPQVNGYYNKPTAALQPTQVVVGMNTATPVITTPHIGGKSM